MKLIRIGIVAAVVMAFAGQAIAADAPKIDPKNRTQGMKEVPAVLQQIGLGCAIADAQFMGNGSEKADGKDIKTNIYEVACSDGLGYLLITRPAPGKTDFYDCLTMRTAADRAAAAAKGGKAATPTVCTLPANADPKQGLAPLMVKAKAPCTLKDARLVGSSKTDMFTVFETSCTEGRGFILTVPDPGSTKPLAATDCIEAPLLGLKCELTTGEQMSQQIIQMSKAANQTACQPNGARWVVTSKAGDRYYEVACTDGKSGFIFQDDANGAFKQVVACGKAQQIAGGCTLTDADVAKTQEAGLYTQLIKQGGYPCTVTKYQTLGLEEAATKREVVELACSEHPDGVWALLPTQGGGKAQIYNCLRATAVGLNCKLTPMPAAYKGLSAQLQSKGKTCDVTNARAITGIVSQQGDDFVEVACGGGGGMVISYAPVPTETVKDVFTCKEAEGTTRACKLK